VRREKVPGYYGDGGGLWLQVGPTRNKSWIFRFTLAGRSREMGLGPFPDVPLAGSTQEVMGPDRQRRTVLLLGARELAAECRELLRKGIDPLEARKAAKLTATAAAAKILTFDQCAAAYIEAHQAGWRNKKHVDQWTNTLHTYASPQFGTLPVSAVDTPLVVKVLEPIWTTKTETAKRLRGRIEKVLGWATTAGYRTGDNPARWSGHLENLLAAPSKVATVEHHAALPYGRMGEFMKALRADTSTSARAVEFIALTVTRTSEAFGATWAEVDLAAKTWIVPPERMKAKREHRVPLSDAAVRLLKQMADLTGKQGFIFPGAKEGKPLSNMAGLVLLRRMGYGDFTVHGFRSSFRDWAAEQTNFPREVAEAALAHVLKDKTEAAYQRGDLFVKRAKLMAAWADYCGRDNTSATVTPIATRRKKTA
jgi:integrase